MANLKSKQLANLLTFSTASIDVVSGSLIPDAANLYNIGSSTVPYLSGSFSNLNVSQGGEVQVTNLFVTDISRFTGSLVLSEQTTTPTAQEGGLMYSGSNFYLGFDS
ncbi:hypothetical protein EB169_06070 [archaeon]|jgi:hypothetical protein|nr:hypothetical protein [archaeon]